MEMTIRQKAVLSEAIDLYRETGQPFHYSQLAQRLRVGNSTTYDILRLLEQRGMLGSEYITPKPAFGPGRSSIRFFPTEEAMELFSYPTKNDVEQEEWESMKARILTSLCQGGAADYRDLLRALLAKIPEARSPLPYCGEVITTLLLGLRVVKYKFREHDLINVVVSAPVTKVGMGALAGFTLGQLLAQGVGQRFAANFQNYMGRYEMALGGLSHESLTALHKFTRQVLGTITAEQS